MNYLALYRKYRPADLDEMVGQNEIRQIINSSIVNNTISHAYLFSGPRGTGKTTTAKIMAKMVNCSNLVDGNPCGECESCKAIQNGVDIIEIDAASNNGVDEIRDLRDKANLVPNVCRYKVYIIDEVHMLTNQAFNALLKTLEEPPKHIIFILATTEYHKIPLTISSRCQKFQFNKIEVYDIVKKLREISDCENISIDEDALVEIAKISDGGMRDSINYLDQLRSFNREHITLNDVFNVCGNVSSSEMVSLLCNIKENKVVDIINYLEELSKHGKNYGKFLEDLLFLLRDLLLLKNNVDYNLIKNDIDEVKKLGNIYSIKDIYYLIENINLLVDKIKYVSRQSVVVVTNFLLYANHFNKGINNNDNNETVDKDNYDSQDNKINFINKQVNSSENNDSNKASIEMVKNNDSIINNVDSVIFREQIINNAFALANKTDKANFVEKWSKLSDYLLNDKYSLIVGKLLDTQIEVVGNNYLIFSSSYDSLINEIYLNFKLLDEFIYDIFKNKYKYVILTQSDWLKQKEKYISDLKKGIKYSVISIEDKKNIEILPKENEKKVESSETSVDKLFQLVGEDLIEFK